MIAKVNGMLILFPKSDKTVWDKMFDSLDDMSDDFMRTRE